MDYLSVLFGIVIVNLLLSGDNALVIALASRRLPPRQRRRAVLWGGAGAVGLRVILTVAAAMLLNLPYLLLTGGLLLEWVAIKLAAADDDRPQIRAAADLGDAIKTILVADLVMSLDNVLAIAGVARGNIPLLVVGLGLSIPLIIWGSRAITLLMERWPIAVVAGAAFLGWTAGGMLLGDPAAKDYAAAYPSLRWALPGLFAAVVVLFDFLRDKPRAMGEG